MKILKEFKISTVDDDWLLEKINDELCARVHSIEGPFWNPEKFLKDEVKEVKEYYLTISMGNKFKTIIYDKCPNKKEIEKQKIKFKLEVLL